MNRTLIVLGAALLWSGQMIWAQKPPPDAIGENLFPPELLMQHHEAIGLSEEQTDAIRATLEEAQPRFTELHERLQKEVEAMAALVRKERVEEKAALEQLDKVLDSEREIKRAHLALMISLRNKLNAAQQAKLRELKQQSGGAPASHAGPPPAIPSKMEKVKAGVEKWREAGRDPSPVAELMQQFEPLMKQGKFKEAETLLDQALKLLQGEPKGKSEKP